MGLRSRVFRIRRSAEFRRYLAMLERAYRGGPERVGQVQADLLERLTTHAYRHVPFQRARLREAGFGPEGIRDVAALALLRPVRKSDLVDEAPEHLLAVPPTSSRVSRKATSGSSGEPFTFFRDQFAQDRGKAVRAYVYRQLGNREGPILELFDNPNAVGQRGACSPGVRFHKLHYQLPVEQQADVLFALAPRVLYGNRSHLLLLGEEARQRGWSVHPPDRVISSSETLSDEDRRALRDSFEAPVHDLYGLSEVATAAWERDPGKSYEPVAPRIVVEVLVDERPARAGETGEIVVTSLDNLVMPILRYASGDLAHVADDSIPGQLHLARIEGRTNDCIRTADGRLVSPWQVGTSAFWGSPTLAGAVRQWQIVQEPSLTLRVSVVPRGATLSDDIRGQIATFLRDAVGASDIDIREVGAIPQEPNGKFRPVRSLARQ